MVCIVDALPPSAPPAPGAQAGHREGASWVLVPGEAAASPSTALPCPSPTCSHLGTSVPTSPPPPGLCRAVPMPWLPPCQSVSDQTWHNAASSSPSALAPLCSGPGPHLSEVGERKEGSSSTPMSRCWRWHGTIPAFIGNTEGLVSPHPVPDAGFLSPYASFPILLFFFFYLFKKKKETVPK